MMEVLSTNSAVQLGAIEMTLALPAEILALSVEEKLELIGKIWDSIPPEEVSLSEEDRKLLDERLKEHEANPTEGRPWADVKSELFRNINKGY